MKRKLLLATLTVCVAATRVGPKLIAQTGPNGTAPRPFYVMAHNPNTLDMADYALYKGANALEPDINVLPDGAVSLTGGNDPNGLVVYHDSVYLTTRVPLTLDDYLEGVHQLAETYPNLALVLLDVKSPAATRDYGTQILNSVRTHLNYGDVNLNVIFNVGSSDDIDVFKDIASKLGEREGISVDGEDDPVKIVEELGDAVDGHIAFGDGTLGPGPNLARAVDWASFLKASWGLPKVISDVYTIETFDMMGFFIEAGADGIIPDHFIQPLEPGGTTFGEFDSSSAAYVTELLDQVKAHPEVRLATRLDNPFKPAVVEAYGVEVKTMDTSGGGTDADLTFTLEGCRGTASVKVDAGAAPNVTGTGRMEAGGTDHVTIRSLDLGRLTRLKVFNDGTGIYSPWDLGEVRVSSAQYLGSDRLKNREYVGMLNATVQPNTSRSLDLTANFTEPLATIACPLPITVNNAPGQCGAPVTFAPKVDGMCPGVTAVSTPASGSTFGIGTTTVTSFAKLDTFESPTCSFTVTVRDVEGPQISCPAPMTVDATSSTGATVTFAPAATDNCSATVSSVPTSGSLFGIGTTTVNSTAQDPSGNQSACSFTVHVNGPSEQMTNLLALVNSLNIKAGTKNGLVVKLNAALANYANKTNTACGPLADFISLAAAQRGKDLSAADADLLIAKATQIRTVIGC